MRTPPIPTSRRAALAAAGLTAALLAGCGGSNNVDSPPTAVSDQVPVSATASASAYTRYAASLQNSETDSGLKLDNVTTPPVSDTEAGLAL